MPGERSLACLQSWVLVWEQGAFPRPLAPPPLPPTTTLVPPSIQNQAGPAQDPAAGAALGATIGLPTGTASVANRLLGANRRQ